MRPLFCLLLVARCLSPLFGQLSEITLTNGMTLTKSCRVKAQAYLFAADSNLLFLTNAPALQNVPAVLTIRGENLVIDFQQAELVGTLERSRPDRFAGLAIKVLGKNITLKNARARGYKVALWAEGVENLLLENCDFSYNYRPRLYSGRERENVADWLSYHHNEQREWLRYGAGIYLENCAGATVKNCRITACQNALLLTRCDGGLVYNNTFQFNSGLGIGLYRSRRNRLMHNRLDWNVRGYSHGFYQRGQDSAGILLYEQSSQNRIAYNSVTHCGDGLFLWAGQATMDTGEGGCNDNWVFGNDFSYAPTNGVEVTFSRNQIQGNYIRECTYGIWGGYSFNSRFNGNLIQDCRVAIAVEHGQQDTILQNYFADDSVGIQLWARPEQPSDWGYAQKRDTRSRDWLIDRNVFMNVRKPLKISASQHVAVNGENLFANFETLLTAERPNEKLKFYRNDLYASLANLSAAWQHPELAPQRSVNFSHADQQPADPYAPLMTPVINLREPDSLQDGILAALPPEAPRGRREIRVGEWGPYDFQRPLAWLTEQQGDTYQIELLGPAGQWWLKGIEGVASISAESGQLPALLTARRDTTSDYLNLQFEYVGAASMTTVFGERIPAGQPYHFGFQRFGKKLAWQVRFFNYGAGTDPLKNPAAFSTLESQAPAAEKTADELAFSWWDAPTPGVQADSFATISTTTFDMASGRYRLELTSDDGARLYLDGRRLIDHWDIHEPAVDEVVTTLGGRHTLRVEHFDAGGFATLGLRIVPLR